MMKKWIITKINTIPVIYQRKCMRLQLTLEVSFDRYKSMKKAWLLTVLVAIYSTDSVFLCLAFTWKLIEHVDKSSLLWCLQKYHSDLPNTSITTASQPWDIIFFCIWMIFLNVCMSVWNHLWHVQILTHLWLETQNICFIYQKVL